VIRAEGKINYISRANRPLLDSIYLDGNLGSRQLAIQSGSIHPVIDDLAASYKVANDTLQVPDLRAHLLGGDLTASLVTRDLAGNSRSHITAAIHSISLKSAQSLKNTPEIRELGVACIAFFAAAAAILGLSDAFEFSWRYQLPAIVMLPAAGAAGIAAIMVFARRRREPSAPATVSARAPELATPAQ